MSTELSQAQKRLNAAQARRRRQTAGPTLNVTDADLAALAEVSPSVVPELEAYVRDLAGQKAVDMVQARAD